MRPVYTQWICNTLQKPPWQKRACIKFCLYFIIFLEYFSIMSVCNNWVSFCSSDGINPPPNIKTVTFDELAPKLQTGDIVLFTGATSSGAIIRLFDNAEFSHVGIVS